MSKIITFNSTNSIFSCYTNPDPELTQIDFFLLFPTFSFWGWGHICLTDLITNVLLLFTWSAHNSHSDVYFFLILALYFCCFGLHLLPYVCHVLLFHYLLSSKFLTQENTSSLLQNTSTIFSGKLWLIAPMFLSQSQNPKS